MKKEYIDKINRLREALQLTEVQTIGIQQELALKYYPKKPPLNKQEDAVVYFIQMMDDYMLYDLLDNTKTYQDVSLNTFIHALEQAFTIFKDAGNDYLDIHSGFCNFASCNYLKKGYRFTGNKTTHSIDLIIETVNGNVNDIYQCHLFCTHKPTTEGIPVLLEIPKTYNYDDDDLPF